MLLLLLSFCPGRHPVIRNGPHACRQLLAAASGGPKVPGAAGSSASLGHGHADSGRPPCECQLLQQRPSNSRSSGFKPANGWMTSSFIDGGYSPRLRPRHGEGNGLKQLAVAGLCRRRFLAVLVVVTNNQLAESRP